MNARRTTLPGPPKLELRKGGLGFWWVAVGDNDHPLMYGPFVDESSAAMGLRVIRIGMGDREPGDIEECITSLIKYLGGTND